MIRVALCAFVLLLAACAPAPASPVPTLALIPVETPLPAPTRPPATPTAPIATLPAAQDVIAVTPVVEVPIPLGAERVVERAINDLAQFLNVDRAGVRLSALETATWGDLAVSCGQDPRAQVQAGVEGYRVLLLANGVTYEYHTDRNTSVVRCPVAEDEVVVLWLSQWKREGPRARSR